MERKKSGKNINKKANPISAVWSPNDGDEKWSEEKDVQWKKKKDMKTKMGMKNEK